MATLLARLACASAVAVLFTALLGFAPAPAYGQPTCALRGEFARHLAENYREVPVARGVAANGTLLEVFADKDGSTWTAMVTWPNGRACLVAAGQSWEALPPPATSDGPAL